MKRACIIAMVLLILLSSTAYAKTELIFSRNNKYGGIIKDIRYSAQDDNYREGVSRILVTYDNNGIQREIIVFQTRKYANRHGWYKKKIFFEEGARKNEYFLTYREATKRRFYRVAYSYDSENKITMKEYHINNNAAAKSRVFRARVYYDKDGGQTKVEEFDAFGNLRMVHQIQAP